MGVQLPYSSIATLRQLTTAVAAIAATSLLQLASMSSSAIKTAALRLLLHTVYVGWQPVVIRSGCNSGQWTSHVASWQCATTWQPANLPACLFICKQLSGLP